MNETSCTDADKRHYWASTMDLAYAFMQQVSDVPIAECEETLAYLPDAAAEAGVEVTFSAKPHADNLPRLHYLRQGLIEPFVEVAAELNACGWVLHVEDAFRTREMQRKLARMPSVLDAVTRRCRWELQDAPVPPQLLYKRMAALVASWPKAATHMSGSALDVSVYHRADSRPIDRGADYLEMSELSPMGSPFVSDDVRRNRERITQIFSRHGFAAYPFEFWHYSRGDIIDALVNDTIPARYSAVDWDPLTRTITPIEDQFTPLNSEQRLWNDVQS